MPTKVWEEIGALRK